MTDDAGMTLSGSIFEILVVTLTKLG